MFAASGSLASRRRSAPAGAFHRSRNAVTCSSRARTTQGCSGIAPRVVAGAPEDRDTTSRPPGCAPPHPGRRPWWSEPRPSGPHREDDTAALTQLGDCEVAEDGPADMPMDDGVEPPQRDLDRLELGQRRHRPVPRQHRCAQRLRGSFCQRRLARTRRSGHQQERRPTHDGATVAGHRSREPDGATHSAGWPVTSATRSMSAS